MPRAALKPIYWKQIAVIWGYYVRTNAACGIETRQDCSSIASLSAYYVRTNAACGIETGIRPDCSSTSALWLRKNQCRVRHWNGIPRKQKTILSFYYVRTNAACGIETTKHNALLAPTNQLRKNQCRVRHWNEQARQPCRIRGYRNYVRTNAACGVKTLYIIFAPCVYCTGSYFLCQNSHFFCS